jgi:DNA-binding IclR family transcriptional regulator
VPELLAALFSSRVRAAVLALLLPRPHLSFSLTDLSRRLGLPVSSLQHECYKLTRLGVLRDERAGNARLYRPDSVWPLQAALTAFVVRALPLTDTLRGTVEQVAGIEAAWVSGDLAARESPVYLVVVGNLGVEEIDGVFARARIALAPAAASGSVELAFFRAEDWAARTGCGDRFARSLLADITIDVCRSDQRETGRHTSGAESGILAR